MAPAISRNAPRTWVSRYLVADSYLGEVLMKVIIGMIASRFSSMPARTIIQLDADIAIMVPETVPSENRPRTGVRTHGIVDFGYGVEVYRGQGG